MQLKTQNHILTIIYFQNVSTTVTSGMDEIVSINSTPSIGQIGI